MLRAFCRLAARKRKTAEHVSLKTRLIVRRSTDPGFNEYEHLDGNP